MSEPSAEDTTRPDLGLSHIALLVRDAEASIAFYRRYAGLSAVHRRRSHEHEVVWLSDLERPFALVLLESDRVEGRLEGFAHLGVGCASREEVDRLADLARADGALISGPEDAGPPVGYYALLHDPDGHNLELSFGQEVGIAVEDARRRPTGPARRGEEAERRFVPPSGPGV